MDNIRENQTEQILHFTLSNINIINFFFVLITFNIWSA